MSLNAMEYSDRYQLSRPQDHSAKVDPSRLSVIEISNHPYASYYRTPSSQDLEAMNVNQFSSPIHDLNANEKLAKNPYTNFAPENYDLNYSQNMSLPNDVTYRPQMVPSSSTPTQRSFQYNPNDYQYQRLTSPSYPNDPNYLESKSPVNTTLQVDRTNLQFSSAQDSQDGNYSRFSPSYNTTGSFQAPKYSNPYISTALQEPSQEIRIEDQSPQHQHPIQPVQPRSLPPISLTLPRLFPITTATDQTQMTLSQPKPTAYASAIPTYRQDHPEQTGPMLASTYGLPPLPDINMNNQATFAINPTAMYQPFNMSNPRQILQHSPYYSQLEAHEGYPGEHQKVFSFVPLPGINTKKRPRRRYDEIERLYPCNWPGCSKSYGTLNHLNAHIVMQKHGPKRHPSEFKDVRKNRKSAASNPEKPKSQK